MKTKTNVLSTVRLFVIASTIAAIVFSTLALTGCGDPDTDETTDSPTPAPAIQLPRTADYDIGGLTQTEGNVVAVTITPKQGKSGGVRTVYYEGVAGTTYASVL